jgi:hypothetical protein
VDGSRYNHSFWYHEVVDNDQIRAAGRIAGRAAGKLAKQASKDWMPVVRNSGTFVRTVVPTAVKPLHSLWHELLGFLFLLFAGLAGFRMWKDAANMPPGKILIMTVFIVVMVGYGISSILKARRISRSIPPS